MTTNPLVLDMLGDDLKTAVLAAQARLTDDTIMARCTQGLWLIERARATINSDLTYAEVIAAMAGLS